jgi:signal transduction histidine kinase
MSIASHELKTPVTTLRLRLDHLLRTVHRTPDAAPERLTRGLEAAVAQVEKLVRLIEELLDVSRIAAGRLELDLERFDLCDLVRDAIERSRDQAAAVGCSIDADLACPAVGEWDRLRLDQVVTNLLTNALKYGQGKPIRVSLRTEGGRVRLDVTDRGMGIDKKDQRRIFERFERAAGQSSGGLGLGLYIVRQIVEAHGGSIDVESTPGAGATFTVELPTARRA